MNKDVFHRVKSFIAYSEMLINFMNYIDEKNTTELRRESFSELKRQMEALEKIGAGVKENMHTFRTAVLKLEKTVDPSQRQTLIERANKAICKLEEHILELPTQ